MGGHDDLAQSAAPAGLLDAAEDGGGHGRRRAVAAGGAHVDLVAQFAQAGHGGGARLLGPGGHGGEEDGLGVFTVGAPRLEPGEDGVGIDVAAHRCGHDHLVQARADIRIVPEQETGPVDVVLHLAPFVPVEREKLTCSSASIRPTCVDGFADGRFVDDRVTNPHFR